MPEYGSGSNPGQRNQYAGIRGQLGWNKQFRPEYQQRQINKPLLAQQPIPP